MVRMKLKRLGKLCAAWVGCYLLAAAMLWVCILKGMEVMAK